MVVVEMTSKSSSYRYLERGAFSLKHFQNNFKGGFYVLFSLMITIYRQMPELLQISIIPNLFLNQLNILMIMVTNFGMQENCKLLWNTKNGEILLK